MTERLYYKDPSLLTFEAVVTRIRDEDGRFVVFLDRSAFYPTSGGQSHDLGTLNGIEVIEVVETDNGDVAHVVRKTAFAVGDKVSGIVDSKRRQKNRQQHTAQHILSQLFVQKLGAETASVHLGDDYGAVELDASAVDDAVVREIEDEGNALVASNLPINILFVSGAELAALPLRKQPQREGTIRVIRIGELDWSACGGTHCNFTAEVGIIKIVGVEKLRGHALVKFLSGEQALDDYRMRLDITDRLAKALTCHPTDLVGKIDKLATENKNLRKMLAQLQKEQLPDRARDLAGKRMTIGNLSLVAERVDDVDGSLIGALASSVADEIGGLAILMCEQRVVIAAAPSAGLAADQLVRELAQKIGLKGGGNARLAQLGGANLERFAEYRDILISLVQNG